MFNESSKIMFLMILISSSLITVSSNSWLSAWMGLEINLLSFIPLMSDNKNLISSETSLKYFLIQAIASSILLFSIILFMTKSNFLNTMILKNDYSKSMILSSLMLKSGMSPFHWWFPNVMEGLSWMNCLILMTWQKIAPLTLISYLVTKFMFLLCIFSSVFIGSIMGLNQTSLRKLMAYSSINHLGWMLASMQSNELMWMIYFLFYSFLSFNLIFMFNNFNLSHFNQLFSSFFNNKMIKLFLFLNFLSLGGLPPFIGFIPKWLVIQQMTFNNQSFLVFFMMLTTLITLFFYIRICYSAFLINYFELNSILITSYYKFSNFLWFFMSFISIFGLFIISLMYF
uniref:NADH dehydrogenase subunit 2 n=1 Tax=Verrallia virginica TaxID=115334 RepID=UPI0026E1FD2E|nr:NADH dehydrogenase subunit 2 [Verrallia virginica]WJW73892.1 NADH dehydrogenase subunit 2 [Verrallia virginica]